jgi:hypothetical protein
LIYGVGIPGKNILVIYPVKPGWVEFVVYTLLSQKFAHIISDTRFWIIMIGNIIWRAGV